MNEHLKSFLKWAVAVILLALPFMAGIGCKENGTAVFYDVIGWLTMAEVIGVVICLILKNRKKQDV